MVILVESSGMAGYGKFEVLSLCSSSVGLNMVNQFGCLTLFSLMWVSSSSCGVWTRLVLCLALFLVWHTLWKCPILWQSLHLALLAGHLCSSLCSCFPHLMHFPSISAGFLDWWLEFEDPCALELFFPNSFHYLILFCCSWPGSVYGHMQKTFMNVLESSWDRFLWWALQSSISNCCIRNSTVRSFPSSFIKFMALSLALVLFMPKKIVSLMALSSALVQGNLHLLAIFTTFAWNRTLLDKA